MIRLLLLAYPAAWRRRYGEELGQLISDTGLSWASGLDLIRAGFAERGRSIRSTATGGNVMLIGPAWRHPNALAVVALVILTPTLLFVAGSMLAYQLGLASLLPPMESISNVLATARFIDLALVVAPVVALLLAVMPLVRFELRAGDGGPEAVIGLRLRLANVLVGLTALAIGALLLWHILSESVLHLGI